MTAAADLLLTNAEVHTLTDPDETHEAVAVRDGRIVRVGDAADVRFLAGVETRVVDLDGRVLLPGFVDAHTHLPLVGRSLVHADLSGASSRDDALSRLRARAAETAGESPGDADESDGGGTQADAESGNDWVLGFGYDESAWDDSRYLGRTDLDAVSADRPVVAFREDTHVASLNRVALDRLGDALPGEGGHREDGLPTGVVVEADAEAVWRALEPDAEETAAHVRTAQRRANEVGITSVHDMVRRSHAPHVYRDLDRAGELTLRVRINYWADHLDAVLETGLRANHGSEMVRTGAIKTFTDGTIGGRTATVSEPYLDANAGDGDSTAAATDADGDDADATDAGAADDSREGRGRWVVPPDNLRELVARADDAGLQVAAHAIGDEAVDAVLDAYDACHDPGAARHRVEHVELASRAAVERFAETGVVASMQPNFLKWAGEGGLYAARIGERRRRVDPFRELVDAGAYLAFGSDGMPLDPLFGVHCAVTAPEDAQRLTVTEALRAYTFGGAYAGFDESRLGTVEAGKRADFVALDASPWASSDAIAEIDVTLTVVDGDVVYDGR